MRVWIDAAPPAAGISVFGMTLAERHVRAALRAGVAVERIVLDGGARGVDATAALLPPDLAGLPLDIVARSGDLAQRLAPLLAPDGAAVLILAGDSVADPRLLGELARERGSVVVTDHAAVPRALPELWSRVFGGWTAHGDGQSCVIRLEPGTALAPATTVADLGRQLLAAPVTRHFEAAGRDQHLAMQRRDVPFWIRAVPDDRARADVERFLFDASYKGSTDVFTRYVYPYLVWPMVLWCTRHRVHPNLVTAISIVATLAAVPFFCAGWWVTGLALAWLMSVLDSVDGKVARLTFTASKLGEVLDHGLDIVHPPLWYLGWAIGLLHLPPEAWLSGPAFALPLYQAAWALLALYVADRLVLAIYKARFRRGLHGHRPLDRIARSLISRRNVNLPLFTVALIVGWGEPAFWLIVWWQAATLLWHATRTAWILARRETPQPAG